MLICYKNLELTSKEICFKNFTCSSFNILNCFDFIHLQCFTVFEFNSQYLKDEVRISNFSKEKHKTNNDEKIDIFQTIYTHCI